MISWHTILKGIWKRIERGNAPPKKPIIRSLHPLTLIAASLLLLVVVYWLFPNERPVTPEKSSFTLRTEDKKIDTVLQDGSHIILSEQSELFIAQDFGKQTRSLVLNGNAFFDVAKNTAVPMIVQTGSVDIVVKGTAFSIKNPDKQKVQIHLLRGLIEVRNRYNAADKIHLYPGQSLVVSKSENKDVKFEIADLPAGSPLKSVFDNDTLRFNNQRMDSLMFLLEKKYETKIEIQNESLKSKRFSGMFVRETLQEALSALQFTYPFSFKTADQKTTIK
jgi:transmembrane sensor